MGDVILTGASRGIGRATALALAADKPDQRLILVARDRPRLDALAAEIEQRGGRALAVSGDLASLRGARELAGALSGLVDAGATLVQNAGLWPSKRAINEDGLETAFVVNHLAPALLQRALIEAGRLRRIMAVSAGLIALGRFDPARTPTGDDFSVFRTYCTTKLCFALATRDLAAAHPELDVIVLHPGVVRSDLGDRPGLLGRLLSFVKRGWEAPEVCGARLSRILGRERWSPPGEARWLFEETERPWPAAANDNAARAVREVTDRLLAKI